MRRLATGLVGIALLAYAADEIAPLGTYKPAERNYWAFQPRQKVTPPEFADKADRAWVKTPIDAFVLAKLKEAGLTPAPEADRVTLIRRVTYDLTGLPPTAAEIADFVNDTAPNAWEKLIDRLLASPHYGEQWAHHWLDVVRFAESDGYEYDMHRPDAYRFRDYVIKSYNEDKPFNQFLREQLAGDEIDPDNQELLVASGYNRLGPLRKNAGNQNVASSRTEVLVERTNIIGSSILGVTVGCARCHDHKFDPFRQSDYYRMQAFFAQSQDHDITMASAEEQAEYKAKLQPLQAEMRRLQQQMRRAPEEEKGKFETQIEELDGKMPLPLTSLYAVNNDVSKMTEIHILQRGEYSAPLARVNPRPLGVLLPEGAPEYPLNVEKPRTKLAEWITQPDHPLTARVYTNRVWQYHFGRGIVSTPNDFGRMGGRPSHPELLDYLANQFVDGGWKLKPLHRMILMSSAYRQASVSPIEKVAMEKDADNALLWKFNMRRLEAEEIRDSMLLLAGRMNFKAGGPSVMVPISPDLVKMLKRPQYWVATKEEKEWDRRSVYMIYKRNLILPFMQTFDAPDTLQSCERRAQSTHAPQALEMLNGQLSNGLAASFAERLMTESKTLDGRIDYAWMHTVGRLPTAEEKRHSAEFLKGRENDSQAMKEFALAMFNLNAFLYVN